MKDDDPRHGTTNGYKHCRCDRCRAAWAKYKREHRRRRRHLLQKWPNGPRFIVGSLTGLAINPRSSRSHGGRDIPLPTLWYVWDAAYCYRIMYEGWKQWEAEETAARLNLEYAQ